MESFWRTYFYFISETFKKYQIISKKCFLNIYEMLELTMDIENMLSHDKSTSKLHNRANFEHNKCIVTLLSTSF